MVGKRISSNPNMVLLDSLVKYQDMLKLKPKLLNEMHMAKTFS